MHHHYPKAATHFLQSQQIDQVLLGSFGIMALMSLTKSLTGMAL